MVDVSILQSLSYVAAAMGVCIATVYYVMVLREQHRNTRLTLETRQAQLFMEIYKTYSSKENQKDRDQMQLIWNYNDIQDFINKYGARTNPDDHASWDTQIAQYIGIGVLIRRGLVKSDLVFDLIFDSVIIFWEKYFPLIYELRKNYLPSYAQDVEYLYDEMKRIAVERGISLPSKDKNLLMKYNYKK